MDKIIRANDTVSKVLKKYNEIPLPAKASMWFVFANMVQKGISLLCTPVFTRLLSIEEYGAYNVYQSWSGILVLILNLNLQGGYFNNKLIHEFEKKDRISSLTLGLSNTVTFTFFVMYLCASEFWNKLLGMSTFFVILIFAEAFFEPAYHLWMGVQRFQFRYRTMLSITIFIAIASPILSVLVVLNTKYRVEARVACFVIVQVLVGIFFCLCILRRDRKVYDRQFWIDGLKYNLPLIPHWLSLNVLGSSDRIMIQRMVGYSEAAVYGVAYTVSNMISLVINGINQALTPYTYGKLKSCQYGSIKKNSIFLMTLIFGGCIAAACLGPEIIRIFAASDYYVARWIMPSVAGSVFFSFQYNLFSIVEFYYAKVKRIMVVSCAAALLNIILNAITIPYFGYVAAGYTTLFSYIFLAFIHGIMSCVVLRTHGIQVQDVYDIKYILLLSVLLCVIIVLLVLVYDLFIVRYLIIVMLLIICVTKRKLIMGKLKSLKGN